MMKNYFLLLLLFSAFFYACPDDPEDEFPVDMGDPFNIDIVTGIQLSDINAQPVGQFGNPNISNGNVRVFPNPSTGIVAVQVFDQDKIVTNCWVFPAERDTTFTDVDYASYMDGYATAEIIDRPELESFILSEASFELNLENLAQGYYRIFYSLDTGERLWDNLYIDPTATDPNSLLNEIADDW